ncbi:class E sortase, partial [Streptomyces somaliensis DSM 40738]|nr:class E sortase [Streptomyces somaliensis DSM 40738]
MTSARPGPEEAGSGSEGSPWFRAADGPRQQEEPVPGAVPEPREWRPYRTPAEPPGAYEAPYGAYGAPVDRSDPQTPYAVPQHAASRPPSGDLPPEAAPRPYGTPQPHTWRQGYDRPDPYGQPQAPYGTDLPADVGTTAVLPVIDPATGPDPAAEPAADPAAGGLDAPGGGPAGGHAARGAGEP